MRDKAIQLACLLPLFFPPALALGEPSTGDAERIFEVPGGGRLFYEWQEGKDGPKVVGVVYSGAPEWLVDQEHPRSHWHEMPALEAITFSHTTVTREQMEYVAQLETVKFLEFFECIYEGNALAPLERMTWLKDLEIDFFIHLAENRFADEPVGPEFFEFLGALVDLEYLDLRKVGGVPIDEQTFRTITELEDLRGLSLVLQDLDAEALSRIKNLSQLDFLSVDGLANPSPLLDGIRGHSELKVLQFSTIRLDDDDVDALSTLAALEALSMGGKTAGSLAPFENLPNLRRLTMRFGEYETEGFRWLRNAPQLEELTLWGAGRADVSLSALRRHEGLRVLRLPGASLSKADIGILGSMPQLEVVGVGNPRISPWYEAARDRLPGVTVEGRR